MNSGRQRYEVFRYSEAGGHPTNEDSFDLRVHPEAPSCWLCALGDGQGGRSGGAAASRVGALGVADRQVMADNDAGHTTLIGLAAADGRVVGASNGDSALWLCWASGRITDLSAKPFKNPPDGTGAARPTPFAATLAEEGLLLAMSDGLWKYVNAERIRDWVRGLRGPALLDALRRAVRSPRTGAFPDDFTAVLLQVAT